MLNLTIAFFICSLITEAAIFFSLSQTSVLRAVGSSTRVRVVGYMSGFLVIHRIRLVVVSAGIDVDVCPSHAHVTIEVTISVSLCLCSSLHYRVSRIRELDISGRPILIKLSHGFIRPFI